MNYLAVFLILIFKFSNVSSIETNAAQAILYDYETKSVIFEKNSDEKMSPSSMSKIMTIYYLFKKIKNGEIALDDKFLVSKKAWKKGGSKMFVKINDKVKVEDLIRGIIVQSGNDAAIALAEGISGSEEDFAREMNQYGKMMGMNTLVFSKLKSR